MVTAKSEGMVGGYRFGRYAMTQLALRRAQIDLRIFADRAQLLEAQLREALAASSIMIEAGEFGRAAGHLIAHAEFVQAGLQALVEGMLESAG